MRCHLFHLPSGRRGGSADAYAGRQRNQHIRHDDLRGGNKDTARIGCQTMPEEYLPVGAFLSGYEEHQFVCSGESSDMRDSIGHLATDGIVMLESYTRLHTCADAVDDLPESLQALGRLGKENDRTCVIYFVQLLLALYDDSRSFGLPDQTVYFRMPSFAIDDDLCAEAARSFVS